MVGNLAERAAEAIGADPLLTRVAAYYHDIGKLANPLAFIENQAGGENIHDQLDPEVSAGILKQHVADGIDLAYKASLPKALIAFIPQHHGTAIMSYFYARAKELAGPGVVVDERKFRHAGPKPQSREAALIMLADGVEASVRSLASRDEPAIRAMVARIIDERIADGQFDECDLTLRDLEQIREAFVGQLLGMYHQPHRLPAEQGRRARVAARRGRRREQRRQRGQRRGIVTRAVVPGTVADRPDHPRRRRARRSRRGAGPDRSPRRSTAAGAPEPGLDRADPVRRRRAGRRSTPTISARRARPTSCRSRSCRPRRSRPIPGRVADAGPRPRRRDFVAAARPPSAPRRHRRVGRAGGRAGRRGPRRPDRRRPLVRRRRAAPARDPRHAPRLRLGPRRAGRGGGDARPRDPTPHAVAIGRPSAGSIARRAQVARSAERR